METYREHREYFVFKSLSFQAKNEVISFAMMLLVYSWEVQFSMNVIFNTTKMLYWESLFKETTEEFDILTQQALEMILHAVLIILERQCVDQLPGGKYWHASNSIKICSESVPTTNKASERDFAILDLLIRTKPNVSIHGIQALTMWARNETPE